MGLLPEFNTRVRALMAAAQQAGHDPRIVSGYRSEADQAKAINSVSQRVNGRPASIIDYARGIPGYAAPVGGSMHQRGEAVDFGSGPSLDWMRQNAASYGVRFPDSLAKSDPVHAEVDPNFWGPVQDPNDIGRPVAVPPSSQPDPAKTVNYQPKRGGLTAAQPMMMLGGPPQQQTHPGAPNMALTNARPEDGFSMDRWASSPLFMMGASVLGAPNIGQGLMQGAMASNQMSQQAMKNQREAQLFPLQLESMQLRNEGERASQPLQRQLMQAQITKASEPASTDDIREFQYAKNNGYTGAFADWMKQKREMNGQTALQITWGTNAAGEYVPMLASRDGKLVAAQLPPGITPMPSETIAFRKADAKERGEAIGKARAALPGIETNAKLMNEALDAVYNDKNLPVMTTGIRALLPNVTEESRASQARIDQVQGKAFLQAFEGLRGGGAITEAEGAKATASISRMQSLAVGTPEYKKAIEDVRKEINALVELARKKATAAEPNYTVRSGAEPIDIGGGIKVRRID